MVHEENEKEQSRPATGVNTLTSSKEDNSQETVVEFGSDFPEGGWKAWLTVLGACCVQFAGFGYTTSFGIYQDYYTRFYITNQSPSTISWIGSINAFLVIFSGIFVGRMYDKGYFYYLIYGGTAITILSLFMLSLCKQDNFYQMFLAQGIGHGLGSGLMYLPSLAVVSHYFNKKRAMAMSIVASGASVGAVVHPIMLNNTIHKIGFPNAVRASAGLITGSLVIACVLMHPRFPPPATTPNLMKSLRRFSKDVPYAFCCLGLMVFPIGMYFPLFYLQLAAVKHNLSITFSFYTLVMLNGASFLGRISPALLTRLIGVVPLVIAGTGGCAVLIFGFSGVKTVAGFVVFALIYGFSLGLFIALIAPLIAVLTDDMNELGLRMGIAFCFCGIGALVGPPVHGALLTDAYIWWKPTVFSGLFGFLGTVFFTAMGVTLHRRNRSQKQMKIDQGSG